MEFAFVCFDPIVNAADESSAACCLSFRLPVETGAPPCMHGHTAKAALPQAGISMADKALAHARQGSVDSSQFICLRTWATASANNCGDHRLRACCRARPGSGSRGWEGREERLRRGMVQGSPAGGGPYSRRLRGSAVEGTPEKPVPGASLRAAPRRPLAVLSVPVGTHGLGLTLGRSGAFLRMEK